MEASQSTALQTEIEELQELVIFQIVPAGFNGCLPDPFNSQDPRTAPTICFKDGVQVERKTATVKIGF